MANTHTLLTDLDSLKIAETYTCDPSECSEKIKNSNQYLKILHQNIRSINRNFDAFCVLLKQIKLTCEIIILSECWLSYVNYTPTIDGYSFFSTANNLNQNDGLVIYINTTLVHNAQVEEYSLTEANCLIVKVDEETIIVAIYRSPSFSNIDPFLASLAILFKKISSRKNIILVGDLNLNLIVCNSNTNKYLDMLSYYGLIAAYNTPTRDNSCLDHVMLKCVSNSIACILQTSITDHNCILFCFQHKLTTQSKLKYNKIDYNKLQDECLKMKCLPCLPNDDIQGSTNKLIESIQSLLSRCSITKTTSKNKCTFKPWITNGLLRCIRNRDRMHSKTRREPNNEILRITYKRYRNFCNNILKKCKHTYEKNLLNESKNDSKKLWATIKNISHLNTPKTVPSELLKLSSSELTSINLVNNFFSNIATNLANNIPTDIPPFPISHNSSSDSLVIFNITNQEVERIIMSLKSTNSAGWDGFPSTAVKVLKDLIVCPLTTIFNRCLEQGEFPDALKKSILIPIHKGGNKDSINNYRPISILPCLSKILEKIINNSLVNFLESNNLLSSKQFGFRKGRSTDDALLAFTDFIVNKIDAKLKCITIFIDLAKAFDTVSFPKLLNKLERLGVRGVQLKLIENYLSNRTQCVKVGDLVSSELPVKHGVPQGSILGPTLFLCYINELCELKLQNCNTIAYADDMTLTFYGDSWDEAYNSAQSGLNKVCHWLAANSLTLNTSKTKFVTFALRNISLSNYILKAHTCFLDIHSLCTCQVIEQVKDIKYLGVIIDEKLSFEKHANSVSKRIRMLSYVFRKLRHVADWNLLKMLYQTLCESVLSYCISTWGGLNKTKMLVVERAQRLILKISLSKNMLFPTVELYKLADVLTVRQLFILACTLRQHSLIPYSKNPKPKRRLYDVCPIRGGKTSLFRRFFGFQGSRLYNNLNKLCRIYDLTKKETKHLICKFLKSQNYLQTENLITVAE